MAARVAIIGGGIIGCAIACWLLSEGRDVTLYEKDVDGLSAVAGSAGLLAIREIEPLAQPGTLLSVPRWLADPNGPLSLRAADLPSLLPWLFAFAASARPEKVRARRAALATLMRTALDDHLELGRRSGLSDHIRHTGALTLYDSSAGLEHAMAEARHVRDILGFETERLSPEEARLRIPALEGPFAGAVYAPEYRMVRDPLTLLRELQAALRERGALRTLAAQRVMPAVAGPQVLDEAGETRSFDAVVVAAGIWSRGFVRDLGLTVLLEAERGYNTTFAGKPFDLPMPVFLGDHGFLASPFEGAIRIGGGVELASPEAPPSRMRARAMLEKMRRYIPALPRVGGVEWMGRRPSTPDSLPVIGPHPSEPRIVFAFGHGHLGLTLSAVTARLVAAMVRGETPDPATNPFSIARFQ